MVLNVDLERNFKDMISMIDSKDSRLHYINEIQHACCRELFISNLYILHYVYMYYNLHKCITIFYKYYRVYLLSYRRLMITDVSKSSWIFT